MTGIGQKQTFYSHQHDDSLLDTSTQVSRRRIAINSEMSKLPLLSGATSDTRSSTKVGY